MKIPKFGENLLQCFGSLAAIECSICGNGEDAGNERSIQMTRILSALFIDLLLATSLLLLSLVMVH